MNLREIGKIGPSRSVFKSMDYRKSRIQVVLYSWRKDLLWIEAPTMKTTDNPSLVLASGTSWMPVCQVGEVAIISWWLCGS